MLWPNYWVIRRHYFNGAYNAKWFVPAGSDHAQVAASQTVLDYFEAVHNHHFEATDDIKLISERVRKLFHETEQPLLDKLLTFLSNHPNVTLLGSDQAGKRAATVSIVPTRQTPQELGRKLVEQGIICGVGHFYAVRLLEAMNIDPDTGVVRLSFAHYTTQDEINQLIIALEKAL